MCSVGSWATLVRDSIDKFLLPVEENVQLEYVQCILGSVL